jgi:hypothetical protein
MTNRVPVLRELELLRQRDAQARARRPPRRFAALITMMT